jgi:lysophospholipase L1-like esterase
MKWAKLLFVQAIILFVGLAAMELAFRWFMPLPVHGGVYRDQSGQIVSVALDEFVLRPNLDLTHEASEFSKRIRTNALGYRRIEPASLTPDYLFLGDSFTFGHGVADDEAFAQLFCLQAKAHCQNLGRPGTDTFDQAKILRYALDHHGMRPANVVLVMLGACWLEGSGNDLGDNLRHRLKSGRVPLERLWVAASSSGDLVRALERWVGGLEITKRTMLVFAGLLKDTLYRCSDDRQLSAAIDATKAALAELQRLAADYRFNVKVFVIHPFQELDGHSPRTEDIIRRALPDEFELVSTAAAFRREHYYPYDGHFNVAGHRTMAAVLERSLIDRTRK